MQSAGGQGRRRTLSQYVSAVGWSERIMQEQAGLSRCKVRRALRAIAVCGGRTPRAELDGCWLAISEASQASPSTCSRLTLSVISSRYNVSAPPNLHELGPQRASRKVRGASMTTIWRLMRTHRNGFRPYRRQSAMNARREHG